MTYVSPWERLLDARRRVMAETGCSQLEAETDICRALADGVISFRGKLKRHSTKCLKAGNTVLEQSDFQISTEISRDDLDWERSCPRKPWIVKRGHITLPGYWELEWIKLSRADVTKALCPAGKGGESAQRAPSEPDIANTDRLALDTAQTPIALGPRSTEASRATAGSARRRGPRLKKLERVKEAMRNEIRQGPLGVADLDSMLEKNLAATHGVSRDTARKARRAVLREIGKH